MECNKEEAIRAKGLAEKKMEGKDFMGARKVALKAQLLFPDLENISQLLMVCDVHCSAERKLFGNEMDWYGILQIEQTADEGAIKKQYRKFALLLHPDKNKFAGAEAAFKLIGEAQRVLLDREKRSLHDMKLRTSVCSRPTVPYRPQQQRSGNSSFGMQNSFRTKTTFIPQHQRAQPPAQPRFSGVQLTFWTVCPFCAVKYQYYIEVLRKHLRCQNCSKSFIAHDINVQGAPAGPNFSMPIFTRQSDVPKQGSSKVEVEQQQTSSTQNVKEEPVPRTRYTSDFSSKMVNEKRKRKQVIESSESSDTGNSSSDTKEDEIVDEGQEFWSERKFESSAGQNVRRSNRRKQQVSYKENMSDDDQVIPPKRAKGSGLNYATEESEDTSKEEESLMTKQAGSAGDAKDNSKEGLRKESASVGDSLPNCNKEIKKEGENGRVKENDFKKSSLLDSDSDSSFKSSPDPEMYVYPDPDFNDFDKFRREECFESGQTWAVYDTLDAMPRFYARVKKVSSPGFKLRITWLEPDPDDEIRRKWASEDLPVSCGEFKLGRSENTEDRLMFSHLISCVKGRQRSSYKIYPNKGETWAIFKNWDVSWATDKDSNKKYEYEFVEILSDYVEGIGLSVANLVKVKGFVSLFCRMVKEGTRSYEIPPSEIYRFSHKVPSFEMSGEERDGVPKGSYELDPASLPPIIEEVVVPIDLKEGVYNGHLNGSCSRSHPGDANPMTGCEETASTSHNNSKDSNSSKVIEDCSSPLASSLEATEIPDPEFYNFDADKSEDKFQIGQFWALYSDEDGLPKYYGQVTKVDHSPDFKLHVAWLDSMPLPKDVIPWKEKDMPICCGRFKARSDEPQVYNATAPFSHQLKAERAGKKNAYAIFPRKSEVWALYKNWSASMTRSDLESSTYEIVEVLEDNDYWIKVLVLERVGGFNSVFRAHSNGGCAVTLQISRSELLRFSHQIPAFRLMKERDGSLRGSWELDPAALPIHFFSS